MRRNTDAVPAIRRKYNDDDRSVSVINEPYKSITQNPGLGQSGQRVEKVEYDCPHEQCHHDRMIRWHSISPVGQDTVEYYCLDPNCAHYLGETLSYAFHGQGRATTPTIKEE